MKQYNSICGAPGCLKEHPNGKYVKVSDVLDLVALTVALSILDTVPPNLVMLMDSLTQDVLRLIRGGRDKEIINAAGQAEKVFNKMYTSCIHRRITVRAKGSVFYCNHEGGSYERSTGGVCKCGVCPLLV
jgi:hypothetical protein